MVIRKCSVSFSIIVGIYFFFQNCELMFFLKLKRLHQPPPSDFDSLPYPLIRWYPQFFSWKMTAKDVKEITYMPLVTFFSVLERPGKTVMIQLRIFGPLPLFDNLNLFHSLNALTILKKIPIYHRWFVFGRGTLMLKANMKVRSINNNM